MEQNENEVLTNSEIASQVISKYAGTTQSNNKRNSEQNENEVLTNSAIANQVISKYTGTVQSIVKRKIPNTVKNDEEYVRKRARNNVAVKKSREKAKNRILETQGRVEQLSQENEELQTKVTLLTKELNVLRALFTNGGFTLPCDLQYLTTGLSTDSDHSNSDTVPESHHNAHHHSVENSNHYSISSAHLPSSIISNRNNNSSNIKLEESKIPPLRPMPRLVNGAPKNMPEVSYSLPGKTFSSTNAEKNTDFPFPPKTSYYKEFGIKSAIFSSSSPTISPLSTHSQYSLPSSSYKISPETQHTSVIRDGTKLSDAKNSSQNTLGKFCIIQDPENNGQVKIVPMNA